MSRHEHTIKLARYIKELREWVGGMTPNTEAHGHRSLRLIMADALSAVDDELSAIDAACRDRKNGDAL